MRSSPFRWPRAILIGVVFNLAILAGSAQDGEKVEFKPPPLKALTEPLPAVFDKRTPESVEDLKAIQDHVAVVRDRVLSATVSVRIGPAFGSGVIVTRDGYVLTAGHVSG